MKATQDSQTALQAVSLDDKYQLEQGSAFMSGTHALVRLLMLQRERDRRAGLQTAGFVSGYRGSPLGGLDTALWSARAALQRHQVVFQPGINEDLAATAVWGTQQLDFARQARVAGVFALWYGKGPGVDRSMDVLKHANAAGTARHGGVLMVAGDDHGAKSSTLPHQSDHVFKAAGIPLLYPATVQEYLDLGLHGWAMSRWSGLWVAMKTVTDVVEASASVLIDPERVKVVLPSDFAYPHDDPHGLNIRWPDTPLAQEARLSNFKWYAALAYVRANRLNHVVWDAEQAWFGILTAGKAYLDTMQALEDLGLDQRACARLGIRVFKCGVVWPLEASTVREFATGLDEILVVEEKRQVLEYALKEELYNWRDDVRPRVYGKFDEKDGRGGEWAMPQGQWLLPALGELSPALIAKAIAARLLNPGQYAAKLGGLPGELRARIEARLAIIEGKERALAAPHVTMARVPTFCAGCPHNLSTHVPEGSQAIGGIGCHYMATFMPERRTEAFTQMGGEGVSWIGQAPFTAEAHRFANLGDGTYFHSGSLAVRAAVAAKVNITYKILYNDAVAMTGGQPVDGVLTVAKVVAQMRAEGVARIEVVTDQPRLYRRWRRHPDWRGVTVHDRTHLDWVQRQLRSVPGCTVLIYDQTCASEKRRRRKKTVAGQPAYPDPARRTVINPAVCEGCGDCSVQSSCVAIEPLETDWGRKRRINQSACNKDESCLQGLCPSLVTVAGGRLRAGVAAGGGAGALAALPALPEPERVPLASPAHRTYGILVTGVGGTGVVTIGQLIGMAGHLDGHAVSVLDMAGLAQKGGAVYSHVQLAAREVPLYATRIATGEADLIIGADLVVSAGNEALAKMRPGLTRAVINADVTPTADFLRDPDWQAPEAALRRNIVEAAGAQDIDFVAATGLATALLGDALYANPLLLGYAWQKGWLPLTRQALERAIELNGKAVAANLAGFLWGRHLAHDPARVRQAAGHGAAEPPQAESPSPVQALTALIERRVRFLTDYQDAAWAERYRQRVARVRAAEQGCAAGEGCALTEAVARSLAKLMAYKDEYEVARLHTAPEFWAALHAQFEGDWQLRFHFAPPLWAGHDPRTGRPVKREWGPWVLPLLRGLAWFKRLRGTPWDVLGYSAERRVERALIQEYEALVDELIAGLTPERYALAVTLAALPEQIRGYGAVKDQALAQVRERWAQGLAQWRAAPVPEVRRVIPIQSAP